MERTGSYSGCLPVFFLIKFCFAGQDRSLSHTIQTLKSIGKIEEADTLRIMCKRGKYDF